MSKFELWEERCKVEKGYEWSKWQKEIPFLSFKEEWKVKVTPPFGGAVVRFSVQHRDDLKTWISVYLDCYDELGIFGEPYWELYPYKCAEYEDVYRCAMNDTEELLDMIDKQIKLQMSNNIATKAKDNLSKFYTYSQNNSHGYFDIDDDVCGYVIIEAKSAEHANDRAEQIGIYFDGCSKGIDCSCCGDRWHKQYDDEDGTDKPMIGDTLAKEANKDIFRDKCYIYYLNGNKEIINF